MVAVAEKLAVEARRLERARTRPGGLGLHWAEQSQELNWAPVYCVRRPKKPTKLVDFSKISNERHLVRLGRLCEKQWLERWAKRRADYVEGQVVNGVDEQQARNEFNRRLCKGEPYWLGKYVLGYDKAVFHLHYFMCETIKKLGMGYRGLREYPRDSYKSTFLTITHAVQQVLRNPNVRILFMSGAEGNASLKMEEAKGHFFADSPLAALFPEHVPLNKTGEGSGKRWVTPAATRVQKEGTFDAAGFTSRMASRHYDLIIGDDVWDETSVGTPEVMASVRKRQEGLDFLLAEPAEGVILYVGTCFAHDDPGVDMIRSGRVHCVVVSGITPLGRSLFPEALPIATLEEQSAAKYTFSCQIMLWPTDDSQSFERAWFRYAYSAEEVYEKARKKELTYRTTILTDFAGDDKVSSDNAAALVVMILSTGDMVVVDQVRDKLRPPDMLDVVFGLADRWAPDEIIVQNAPLERSLKGFIEAIS